MDGQRISDGKGNAFLQSSQPKEQLEQVIITLGRKEVSNIQRGIHGRSKHILFNICKKGVEMFNIKLTRSIDVSRSLKIKLKGCLIKLTSF